MKLKFFSVMFLLLSFAIFSQEATVDELFTKGNQAYISGKYLEAKENYQKLLKVRKISTLIHLLYQNILIILPKLIL